MRDRLIELLKKSDEYASGVCTDYEEVIEVCAEYLIGEGVIVPPVKMGQTVYPLDADPRFPAVIERIEILSNEIYFHWAQYDVGIDCTECWDEDCFSPSDIGKTVFLTREDAEKALAERKK